MLFLSFPLHTVFDHGFISVPASPIKVSTPVTQDVPVLQNASYSPKAYNEDLPVEAQSLVPKT